ncbi:(2Fe-2S) ferredoxin domain-containing protein [Hymenobacter edaphi]|uniref:(2Fe-2S) ferredoxin domain-containing protein n=1 Tax=Hymenobacter edaphi TaxID=2211146 RepID=A0A328B9J9_9BACT|nr:(2Fe-2S) ferredoxin domain-containing protein [Hymenobacter edaphi]RAK63803.1 (2Fe-2S) ferredoxin domain-containing protein [Hymenobacter edaphi]
MTYQHHLFICTNQKSEVGKDVAKAIKKELKKQDLKSLLLGGKKRKNRVQTVGCLDVCKHCKKGPGAALVVYPEGIWYGDVQPKDAADLVAQQLGNNQPVKRLQIEP